MANALLNLVLSLFFGIASVISSVVFVPILGLFQAIIPNFDSFLDTTLTFWNRVLNGANFFKHVFLNITGFPKTLLYLLFTFYFAKFAFTATKRSFKFIANIYWFVRGHKTGTGE